MAYSVIAKTSNTYTPETPYLANTSDVYIPNPQWWDVYNILKNHPDLDVNGGAWKYAYIVLIDDSIPSINFTLNNSTTSDCQMVTTSDDATYTTTNTTNTTINHVWNDTNAPTCIEGNSTYKTRYYIYWSNKTDNDIVSLRFVNIHNTHVYDLIGIVLHSAKFSNSLCPSTRFNSISFLRFINGGNFNLTTSIPGYLLGYCINLQYVDDLTTYNLRYIDSLSNNTTYYGSNQFIKELGSLVSVGGASGSPLAMFRNFRYLKFVLGQSSTTLVGLFAYLIGTDHIDGIINCNSCTSIHSMFRGCYSLRKFPILIRDEPFLSTVASMYQYCRNAKTLPDILINSASYDATFYECCSLLVLPHTYKFDNVTNLSTTFYSCNSLHTIESPINFSGIALSTGVNLTFSYCTSLENITFVAGTLKLSLTLQYSLYLTKTSILSILNGLDLTTPATMQTLTFHSATKALINSDSELSALRDTVLASGKWQIA